MKKSHAHIQTPHDHLTPPQKNIRTLACTQAPAHTHTRAQEDKSMCQTKLVCLYGSVQDAFPRNKYFHTLAQHPCTHTSARTNTHTTFNYMHTRTKGRVPKSHDQRACTEESKVLFRGKDTCPQQSMPALHVDVNEEKSKKFLRVSMCVFACFNVCVSMYVGTIIISQHL